MKEKLKELLMIFEIEERNAWARYQKLESQQQIRNEFFWRWIECFAAADIVQKFILNLVEKNQDEE